MTKKRSLEENENINDFAEKLSGEILAKFANSEKSIKNEFLKLEELLQEGV